MTPYPYVRRIHRNRRAVAKPQSLRDTIVHALALPARPAAHHGSFVHGYRPGEHTLVRIGELLHWVAEHQVSAGRPDYAGRQLRRALVPAGNDGAVSGDDAAPGGGVRQSRRCAINRRGHAAMDAGTAHRRANGGCLCPGMVQAVAPTQRSPSRPCRPLAMLYARARGTVLTAMLRDGRGGDQGGGARQCLITGVTDFDLPP
ncbi:MAG: hypothetical protein JWO26_1790 [Rhodospirillales bacterium]|nr:hypothetical protein [Rhodospirillales bacterium]